MYISTQHKTLLILSASEPESKNPFSSRATLSPEIALPRKRSSVNPQPPGL
jgi:hypothetical protein